MSRLCEFSGAKAKFSWIQLVGTKVGNKVAAQLGTLFPLQSFIDKWGRKLFVFLFTNNGSPQSFSMSRRYAMCKGNETKEIVWRKLVRKKTKTWTRKRKRSKVMLEQRWLFSFISAGEWSVKFVTCCYRDISFMLARFSLMPNVLTDETHSRTWSLGIQYVLAPPTLDSKVKMRRLRACWAVQRRNWKACYAEHNHEKFTLNIL